MQKTIYTVTTAAAVLNCDSKTVERLCRAGSLRGYKRLRRWYIIHSDLVEYIQGGETTNTNHEKSSDV